MQLSRRRRSIAHLRKVTTRVVLGGGALALGAVLPGALPAAAAPSSATGNDVSYPQCSSSLPTGAAFGIVGVDDGIANVANPCLSAELAWASATSGTATSSFSTSPQPKTQLYVNTGDPGDVYNGRPIGDWPASNAGGGTDPYGTCTTTVVSLGKHKTTTAGQNSPACAWQYGWNMAAQDVQTFVRSALSNHPSMDQNAGDYTSWLDVETGNTWQGSKNGGLAMNDAVLEGMVAFVSSQTTSAGSPATVGVYSTSYQWSQITGGESAVDANWTSLTHSTSPSSLDGLSDWVPGATSAASADSICAADGAFTRTGATAAHVTLAQWTANNLDGDVSC